MLIQHLIPVILDNGAGARSDSRGLHSNLALVKDKIKKRGSEPSTKKCLILINFSTCGLFLPLFSSFLFFKTYLEDLGRCEREPTWENRINFFHCYLLKCCKAIQEDFSTLMQHCVYYSTVFFLISLFRSNG